MRVPGAAQAAAPVGEDGAELGELEDGQVDPGAFEQRRGGEEGDRDGRQRHQPAGPDHVRSDQAAKLPLHPAGESVHFRIRTVPVRDLVLRRDLVIVLGEHRKDPLLDGLGLAEQIPGLDAVFEGGLDGGGRLEVEGVGKLMASAHPGQGGVRPAGVLAHPVSQVHDEERQAGRGDAEFVGDAGVELQMEVEEEDHVAHGLAHVSVDRVPGHSL